MTNEKTTAELTANPTREQQLEMLNSMEKGRADSGYLDFEPGEERKVVFLGWKNIPGMGTNVGKEVPAVVFLVDDGKEQINADAVVISYFKKQTIGVARLVTCTGKKTTSNGTYKTFDFFELNVKK